MVGLSYYDTVVGYIIYINVFYIINITPFSLFSLMIFIIAYRIIGAFRGVFLKQGSFINAD